MTQHVYPVLCYDDPDAAIQQLTSALGFISIAEHRDESGRVYHAELRSDSGVIMLSGRRTADAGNPWSDAHYGTYVYVEDIDNHHARAQAGGADIIMALRDTSYGSREYSVRDAQGQLWSFGTYHPTA